jgi:hypothetical protein
MLEEQDGKPGANLGSGKVSALVAYVVISVVIFGIPVIFHPGALHIGYFSDPAMMMWYLVWWPYAIGNHLNPFITHAVWPQTGYNLTWATTPAVALAMVPFTAPFCPVEAASITPVPSMRTVLAEA